MKKSFIISIAALMLCACGGTNQNSGNNSTAPNENDTLSEYVAYQAYKLINPDSAAALPRYERGKLYYESYSSPDPETDRSESVWCFPKKGDGYVAVYELEDCMSVGDCFGCEILAFKIYDFSNGQFKEDKSLLPKPSFDDFYKNEALWFYNPKDKNLDSTKASFAENGFKYMCYGLDTIATFVTGYGDESLKIFYRFDGEKFVATTKNNENPLYPLITEYGLGCIHIGEIPPQKLPGFDVNTMGRTIYYNRNAKKEFKISLAADGTTDTITIYSPKYSYRFWGGGYGYLNVGSDAVSDEFTNCFKDNDMYNASVDDDDYYLNPDGGVINFHAPEHKKIEYIKIYKKENTISDLEDLIQYTSETSTAYDKYLSRPMVEGEDYKYFSDGTGLFICTTWDIRYVVHQLKTNKKKITMIDYCYDLSFDDIKLLKEQFPNLVKLYITYQPKDKEVYAWLKENGIILSEDCLAPY